MKTQTPAVSQASIHKAVETLLETGARHSVVYQHPKLVVKATRRHKPDKRATRTELVLTMGAPNYRERAHIRVLQKSGVAFPVHTPSLYLYPKKKAKR